MGNPESWALQPGDDISPELGAMKLIGGGATYEAYFAFDERLYAPVVVKVVRPDQVEDESALASLAREVEMLRRLDHPGVVRSFSAELGGPRPRVVLENVDGPNLSALHYLRHAGVCHLDIKPSNVIMGAPAKLIDLSVARDVKESLELDHPIGSDEYMAPEQCDPRGAGGPGHAADMWGLGATMFKAATGYRAFDAEREDERWPQLVDAPYAMPDQVPEELDRLLVRCLDRGPGRRPEPAEFAEALEPMMAALPKARLSGFKVTL